MTDNDLNTEFTEWLHAQGIKLSTAQAHAAHALLEAAQQHQAIFTARATGKTLILTKLEEFLTGRPTRAE